MKKQIIIHGVYIVICIVLLAYAFIQKTIATQQWELANKNAIEAQKNAEEALKQQDIAKKNETTAKMHQAITEELQLKLGECQKRNKK